MLLWKTALSQSGVSKVKMKENIMENSMVNKSSEISFSKQVTIFVSLIKNKGSIVVALPLMITKKSHHSAQTLYWPCKFDHQSGQTICTRFAGMKSIESKNNYRRIIQQIVGIFCTYIKGVSYNFLSHIIIFEIFLLNTLKINQMSFQSPLLFLPLEF